MKKFTRIIAAIILPAMLISLTACGGETTATSSVNSEVSSSGQINQNASAPADITAQIMTDILFPSMAQIKEERLATYYDIDLDKIESFSAYICGSGAYPDEIAIFKMKSVDDVNDVKTVLDARLVKQTNTFIDYTPAEMYKIDGSNIVINGNYIAFIICTDNAGAISTFKEMTK